MAKWTAFPHAGDYEFDAASVKKNWARLHQGDAEPLPKDAKVLEAWALFHNGEFQKAADAGVDLLFAPTADEMYPSGFQTWVDVEELGSVLEGVHRPGHFRGVATVCLKLFNIVRPQLAFYGQKDAQQVAVLRQMIRDLSTEWASGGVRICPP